MALNFTQLGPFIGLYADAVERWVENVVIRSAEGIAEEVVPATPVKTGKARTNWVAQLGSQFSGVLESKGTGAGPAIAQIKSTARRWRPGQSLNITNNVPYIEDLNKGKSTQAQAGFIEAAFVRGVQRGVAKAGRIEDFF